MVVEETEIVFKMRTVWRNWLWNKTPAQKNPKSRKKTKNKDFTKRNKFLFLFYCWTFFLIVIQVVLIGDSSSVSHFEIQCKPLNVITDNVIIRLMWSNWSSPKTFLINYCMKNLVIVIKRWILLSVWKRGRLKSIQII